MSSDDVPPTWINKALAAFAYQEAPLTYQVAQQSCLVRLPHEDPADRFFTATAHVYELAFATADQAILQRSGFCSLPNR